MNQGINGSQEPIKPRVTPPAVRRSSKLTAKFCDNAKPGDYFDGAGLYLSLSETGRKFWKVACYLEGKRKKLSLGKYPDISLAV